jgi:hypothetical protein
MIHPSKLYVVLCNLEQQYLSILSSPYERSTTIEEERLHWRP